MGPITFVPIQENDLKQLHAWVHVPHVKKWWCSDALPWDQFVKKYSKFLQPSTIWGYIIHVDERPIGFIQAHDASEADSEGNSEPAGTYGMDLYIADIDYIGKGYGTAILRQFIEKLKQEHPVKKFIIDPDVHNIAAIKTYSKVGFKPVKEVASSTLGNLLIMELLLDA